MLLMPDSSPMQCNPSIQLHLCPPPSFPPVSPPPPPILSVDWHCAVWYEVNMGCFNIHMAWHRACSARAVEQVVTRNSNSFWEAAALLAAQLLPAESALVEGSTSIGHSAVVQWMCPPGPEQILQARAVQRDSSLPFPIFPALCC